MKVLISIAFVMGLVLASVEVSAEEALPVLTSKDGCSDGEYIYKVDDKIRTKLSVRDPITHKIVFKDFPDGIRQVCAKDEKTGGYRWNSIDKMVDGKLVRAPGNDSFVPSKPIGILKAITQEEIQQGLKENQFCHLNGEAVSLGWVEPSKKGDKFYRCLKIYDDNFNVTGTGWVEMVLKNNELVTTPI